MQMQCRCRPLYLGRLSSTNHTQPLQAGGQRRRRALGAAKVSRDQTLGLHATIDSTFFCEFLAVAGGSQGRIRAPCGRLHRQDLACPLHPCFPASHHEEPRLRVTAQELAPCALCYTDHMIATAKCSDTDGDLCVACF